MTTIDRCAILSELRVQYSFSCPGKAFLFVHHVVGGLHLDLILYIKESGSPHCDARTSMITPHLTINLRYLTGFVGFSNILYGSQIQDRRRYVLYIPSVRTKTKGGDGYVYTLRAQ